MRDQMKPLLLISAQFVVMLDTAVMNVALPVLGADLGLGPVGTAWLLNAYFVTFGGTLLASGRAADVFGRRRMFIIGAALLLLGAVIGLMATNVGTVVVARVVQAAGAAALGPAAMSAILASTTGDARGTLVSRWGAASTLGGALGVALGGMAAAVAGWQAVFALTGLASASVLTLGARMLPRDERANRRSFDAPGVGLATLMSLALAATILALPEHGVLSSQVIVGASAIAALAVALVAWEQRAAEPVLPPLLLAQPRVRAALLVNTLGGASRIGVFVLVAFLLQRVLEFDVGVAGVAMLPTSLFGFAVSVSLLPHLLRRLGPERVVLLGLLALAAAHLVFASASSTSEYVLQVLPGLALAAAGVALSFTPTTLILARAAGPADSGIVSGAASATAQLGGMLGIALFGTVDAIVTAHANDLPAHAGLSASFLLAGALAAVAGMIALRGLKREDATTSTATPPPASGALVAGEREAQR
jgi:MFS family permease